MVVLKNRSDIQLSEGNRRKTQRFKTVAKYQVTFASFLLTDGKIVTMTTPKNPQND